MAKEYDYTQCRLQKVGENVHMVSYIPLKEGVAIGANVEVLDDSGGSMGLWEVLSMGDPVTKEFVREGERQHKNHRKATDI